MDSATALQLGRARQLVWRDLAALRERLAALAREHRVTVMAGRTHGQQAAPITFGYKIAVWLDELRRHEDRLEQCGPRLLVGQLSGAVGTLASIGESGPRVQELMCAQLGLEPPE